MLHPITERQSSFYPSPCALSPCLPWLLWHRYCHRQPTLEIAFNVLNCFFLCVCLVPEFSVCVCVCAWVSHVCLHVCVCVCRVCCLLFWCALPRLNSSFELLSWTWDLLPVLDVLLLHVAAAASASACRRRRCRPHFHRKRYFNFRLSAFPTRQTHPDTPLLFDVSVLMSHCPLSLLISNGQLNSTLLHFNNNNDKNCILPHSTPRAYPQCEILTKTNPKWAQNEPDRALPTDTAGHWGRHWNRNESLSYWTTTDKLHTPNTPNTHSHTSIKGTPRIASPK